MESSILPRMSQLLKKGFRSQVSSLKSKSAFCDLRPGTCDLRPETLNPDNFGTDKGICRNYRDNVFVSTADYFGLHACRSECISCPDTLVGVLRRRSTGAGLTGAYPITTSLQIGLGFQAERDWITDVSPANTVPRQSWRSELAPFVLFDRTRGSGSDTRGYRLSYSQGWDGSLFLRSLDSTRESVQLTHYAGDPLTHGRNSFAFHIQGSWVRPNGDSPLLLERRFYPGDETVRGFSRGALTPWAAVPDGANSALQASGADTVLGFSTEYRVPMRGALNSAAFFDLGWTRIDPKDTEQLGTGASLIEETNSAARNPPACAPDLFLESASDQCSAQQSRLSSSPCRATNCAPLRVRHFLLKLQVARPTSQVKTLQRVTCDLQPFKG